MVPVRHLVGCFGLNGPLGNSKANADKEWGFFVCVCLFLTIVYWVFLFVLPLSRERLDID